MVVVEVGATEVEDVVVAPVRFGFWPVTASVEMDVDEVEVAPAGSDTAFVVVVDDSVPEGAAMAAPSIR